MLIKSTPNWTPACPGDAVAYSAMPVWSEPGAKPGGPPASDGLNARFGEPTPASARVDVSGTGVLGTSVLGMRLRDLRIEQRVQEEQGRDVFELLEDESQAPATAHMAATTKGGVSGPYPWRRPV
ncbi:hypothetical protein [Actinomadura litoris]|uniref:hypothetical protein n=1 Tax=Actinomadura litoris TaxID=2678616 RepID=UPI001FA70F59|nr:hypothetical protein [Actinomadura litoris]